LKTAEQSFAVQLPVMVLTTDDGTGTRLSVWSYGAGRIHIQSHSSRKLCVAGCGLTFKAVAQRGQQPSKNEDETG